MAVKGSVLVAALVMIGVLLVACDDHRAATDCINWRYGSGDEPAAGVIPAEYDRAGEYKSNSRRDTRAALHDSPQNQCGQTGSAADLAWGITKGRADVMIAELDSGIEWRDAGAMRDLATKVHINLGEAKPPCYPATSSGDCNHDGTFDISDFGAIPDLNGNGLADPEDLILSPTYSNRVDNDGNGYVDDIAGWDFLYGDNDPLDTVGYGHGTGEARDSTAAENGSGDVGTCPKCTVLPIRVGDSFIADGGRFAAGVYFALDSGAAVVQEALGAISNPRQSQQAINSAYKRGVVVVASMADEESKHPNLPGSLEHTMALNSITERKHALADSDGWLAMNGCTNFGGHTFVSVESASCSSEATGLGAGIVGLVESEARNVGLTLSTNEVMQVVRSNADDVDFSTPNSKDPANNYSSSNGDLTTSERYHTVAGWDQYTGYGRMNAYEATRLVKAKRIPPEADLLTPTWFSLLPTSGNATITGTVAARFADSYDYRIEWAPGVQPPQYPATDSWHVVKSESGLTAGKSVSASMSLATIAAALPNGGNGPSVGSDGKPDEDRFAVRFRIVVTAKGGTGAGLVGMSQKQVFVHHDADLRSGYPKSVPGASTASPVFANLDGVAGDELIVATTDGDIHAYDASGSDIAGFPVHTAVAPWWPTWSKTAAADGVTASRSAVMVGAPAVADIDGNGSLDIVVTDIDGNVWAWNNKGVALPGFGTTTVEGHTLSQVHVNLAYSRDSIATQDQFNRTQPSFWSSPALGNIDDHPGLEIVAAAMDRHVYAWHDDGTPVPGFPVLVVDPAKVQSVDPTSHKVTFKADSNVEMGGNLVATPALADFTGDGRDEIAIGAQESYQETLNADSVSVAGLLDQVKVAGNARMYLISPDGNDAAGTTNPNQPSAQAYLPGWPFPVAQLTLAVLPGIGDGVATQAAIGDVSTLNAGKEIIATSAGGPVYVLTPQGKSVYGNSIISGKPISLAWAGGLLGEAYSQFGGNRNSGDIRVTVSGFSGPAIGKLDGDSLGDVSAPTVGINHLIDLETPDHQFGDTQLGAWRATDAHELDGFPRVTSDLAFFVTPAIGDVDGDGKNEAIAGNGVYLLDAFEADGSSPADWPKLTGGWVIGTPGMGDLDGDGKADIAVVRRDGTVLVWKTNQPVATLNQWSRFGGNGRNDGNPAS
jgi:hypothetical protein